jgi:outer membrane protein assembly factor BamD
MRRPALVLALLLLAACGGKHVSLTGDLKYGKTAEENYQAGVAELKGGNADDAQKFFEHVRTRFPYSAQAVLADLGVADAHFAAGRFLEAADAYESFLKLHPTHEKADYAAYRIGIAHLREGPSNFFLFPEPYEKDQVRVKEAIAKLEQFVARYPSSQYLPDAQRQLTAAKDKLADHEWYVAEFYRKRRRWAGAAGRYEALVKEYPGSRHESEALLLLAEMYLKLNERFRAQQTLQQLIVKHPGHPRRAEAERLLAQIR